MKNAFFLALFLFKFQYNYSQTIRARYEAPIAIDPSQTTYVANETSVPSLRSLTLSGFNECYNNDYAYAYGRQAINKESFQLSKRQKQAVKAERYEFKAKMNVLLDKSDIDLLFQHSFNTKSSLVILYIPIGKRSWPFGKA